MSIINGEYIKVLANMIDVSEEVVGAIKYNSITTQQIKEAIAKVQELHKEEYLVIKDYKLIYEDIIKKLNNYLKRYNRDKLEKGKKYKVNTKEFTLYGVLMDIWTIVESDDTGRVEEITLYEFESCAIHKNNELHSMHDFYTLRESNIEDIEVYIRK